MARSQSKDDVVTTYAVLQLGTGTAQGLWFGPYAWFLHAVLGFEATEIAMLWGVGFVVKMLLEIPSGAWAERENTSNLLRLSYGAFAIYAFLYAGAVGFVGPARAGRMPTDVVLTIALMAEGIYGIGTATLSGTLDAWADEHERAGAADSGQFRQRLTAIKQLKQVLTFGPMALFGLGSFWLAARGGGWLYLPWLGAGITYLLLSTLARRRIVSRNRPGDGIGQTLTNTLLIVRRAHRRTSLGTTGQFGMRALSYLVRHRLAARAFVYSTLIWVLFWSVQAFWVIFAIRTVGIDSAGTLALGLPVLAAIAAIGDLASAIGPWRIRRAGSDPRDASHAISFWCFALAGTLLLQLVAPVSGWVPLLVFAAGFAGAKFIEGRIRVLLETLVNETIISERATHQSVEVFFRSFGSLSFISAAALLMRKDPLACWLFLAACAVVAGLTFRAWPLATSQLGRGGLPHNADCSPIPTKVAGEGAGFGNTLPKLATPCLAILVVYGLLSWAPSGSVWAGAARVVGGPSAAIVSLEAELVAQRQADSEGVSRLDEHGAKIRQEWRLRASMPDGTPDAAALRCQTSVPAASLPGTALRVYPKRCRADECLSPALPLVAAHDGTAIIAFSIPPLGGADLSAATGVASPFRCWTIPFEDDYAEAVETTLLEPALVQPSVPVLFSGMDLVVVRVDYLLIFIVLLGNVVLIGLGLVCYARVRRVRGSLTELEQRLGFLRKTTEEPGATIDPTDLLTSLFPRQLLDDTDTTFAEVREQLGAVAVFFGAIQRMERLGDGGDTATGRPRREITDHWLFSRRLASGLPGDEDSQRELIFAQLKARIRDADKDPGREAVQVTERVFAPEDGLQMGVVWQHENLDHGESVITFAGAVFRSDATTYMDDMQLAILRSFRMVATIHQRAHHVRREVFFALHQANKQLTSLSHQTEMLSSNPTEDGFERVLEEMQEAADFNTWRLGRGSQVSGTTDIGEAVRRFLDQQADAGYLVQGGRFTIDIDDGALTDPWIGDELTWIVLKPVLLNLVNNAVVHGGVADGELCLKVVVSPQQRPSAVRLELSNVAKDDSPPARGRWGLQECRRYVALMGGTWDFDGLEEDRFVVRFRIPRRS